MAMIGRDSVFGGSVALDGAVALNDAIVQSPGYGIGSRYRSASQGCRAERVFPHCPYPARTGAPRAGPTIGRMQRGSHGRSPLVAVAIIRIPSRQYSNHRYRPFGCFRVRVERSRDARSSNGFDAAQLRLPPCRLNCFPLTHQHCKTSGGDSDEHYHFARPVSHSDSTSRGVGLREFHDPWPESL